MALVDSLLKMLVQQNGDRAVLTLGQPPALTADGRPLRLFFPTFTPAMRSQLLGDLLTDARLAKLAAAETVAFDYTSPELGPFAVTMRGEGANEVVFQRPMPDPEPEAAEDTTDGLVDAEVARVVDSLSPSREPAVASPEARAALDDLLQAAVRMRASDLHLADGESPVVRVDGWLRPLRQAQADAEDALDALLPGDLGARVDRGEGIDHSLDLGATRVRAHVYRTANGRAAALRLLHRRPVPLAELGLPVDLRELVQVPHGLVLLTGPTGSGKSSTLAALARHALPGKVLVTLEDPIEYVYDHDDSSLVRQRQVGRDTPSFADGLRDAMREDPDLILIGELRDAATLELALTAAETGHLVLASLHSRSASSAIDRILDGVSAAQQAQARIQLASSLRAVVAQRLLPGKHGGRVAALEILRSTHGVSNLIREGRSAQLATAIQSGAAQGMLPLERCLRDLVLQSRIAAEDALAAANDEDALRRLLAAR